MPFIHHKYDGEQGRCSISNRNGVILTSILPDGLNSPCINASFSHRGFGGNNTATTAMLAINSPELKLQASNFKLRPFCGV